MAIGEYAAIRDHRRIHEGFGQLDCRYYEIGELISVQKSVHPQVLLLTHTSGYNSWRSLKEYINLVPQVTDDISDLLCHNGDIRMGPRTIQNSSGKFFV